MAIYCRIDGISGPLTGKYLGWIELSKAVWAGFMGGNATRVDVAMPRDQVASAILNRGFRGKGFARVEIAFTASPESAPYERIDLGRVVVSPPFGTDDSGLLQLFSFVVNAAAERDPSTGATTGRRVQGIIRITTQ